MKVLVTGARGFIAKNLIAELGTSPDIDVLEYSRDTGLTLLEKYCREADFVFHLAGVNRPKDDSEFMEGNYGFTSDLLQVLKRTGNPCPVLMSSSIQAERNNPYGMSKLASETLLLNYSKDTGAKILIYRLPNVFGKWCKPNYNSVIATFCQNIARGNPITINDENAVLELVYIDDVVREFVNQLTDEKHKIKEQYGDIPCKYNKKLGEITEYLYAFKRSREEKTVPDLADPFIKKLYSTYLSYLPEEEFKYGLKMNVDERGSFTEFIRTPDRGQVSINISKPGITKGNHWHHTKNEKFLVISGKGVIRFRKIGSEQVIEYLVNGDKFEVVDIPPGYTHNIENLGETEMVTVMWANESFDPEKPDTHFLEV